MQAAANSGTCDGESSFIASVATMAASGEPSGSNEGLGPTARIEFVNGKLIPFPLILFVKLYCNFYVGLGSTYIKQ